MMMRSLLLFPLTLLAVLSTPGQCPAAPGGIERLPLDRFGNGAAPFTFYSAMNDSARVVVRDGASWRAMWTAIHRNMSPAPALPAVDFAAEMVVVAALGRRPTGGWEIVVDSALASAEHVEVYVRRLAPGRGCLTTAAISTPVDVVRIPRRTLPVRFSERLVREDCE